MKINGMTTQAIAAYNSRVKGSPVKKSKAWEQDSIELSGDARSFLDVLHATKSAVMEPTIQAKLDAIRQGVADGTYGSDSVTLAHSILFSAEQ